MRQGEKWTESRKTKGKRNGKGEDRRGETRMTISLVKEGRETRL